MSQASELWLEHFRSALRWRRKVERELLTVPLTLTQWLVLDALEAIHEQTDGAVSQLQIGQRLEIDKATISDVMDRLSLRGLVDREPGYPGPEWRIYPTEEGSHRAALGRQIVEVASQVFSDALSRPARPEESGDELRKLLAAW